MKIKHHMQPTLMFWLALTCGWATMQPTFAAETPTRVIGGATASARLVREMFSRPVEEKMAVHANVMGATTIGTAWTEGQVLAEFLPHADHAIVNIRLIGSMLASNLSTRGGIRVRSESHTSIDAHKHITISTDEIQTAAAIASCSTSMWVRSISANSRMVERMAGRRVGRQRGEAEITTSNRAAREIESHLDREVDVLMEKMNSSQKGTLGQDLPLDIRFQTSRDRLFVSLLTEDIKRRPGGNLGVVAADHDLGFCAHQSLIEIAVGKLARNKEITDKRVLEVIEAITGNAPRPLWVHDRRPRWSIQMADNDRPIEVLFDKQGIHVVMVTTALKVGEDKYVTPINISVHYKLEPTIDGPHLMRQGDVGISTPSNPAQAGMIQAFLKGKLSAFFQKDLYFDGMVPPIGGSGGKLRRLQLTRLSTDSGWLLMGYDLRQTEVAAK